MDKPAATAAQYAAAVFNVHPMASNVFDAFSGVENLSATNPATALPAVFIPSQTICTAPFVQSYAATAALPIAPPADTKAPPIAEATSPILLNKTFY